MKSPVCETEADSDELLVFLHNRFDAQVRPKRHPCDVANFDEQVVVVDASCGAAVLRGADIFAPGVLTCTGTALKSHFYPKIRVLENRFEENSLK